MSCRATRNSRKDPKITRYYFFFFVCFEICSVNLPQFGWAFSDALPKYNVWYEKFLEGKIEDTHEMGIFPLRSFFFFCIFGDEIKRYDIKAGVSFCKSKVKKVFCICSRPPPTALNPLLKRIQWGYTLHSLLALPHSFDSHSPTQLSSSIPAIHFSQNTTKCYTKNEKFIAGYFASLFSHFASFFCVPHYFVPRAAVSRNVNCSDAN